MQPIRIRPIMFPLLLAIFATAAIAGSARADADALHIADGDSFRIGTQRYRLHDIDAPELYQDCTDSRGRNWSCGKRARDELRRVIGRHELNCSPVTRDRYRRIVAVCTAGGRDIGEAMVRAGYATAYKRRGYVSRYEGAEQEARRERRGIWAGRFEQPRAWRDNHSRDDVAPGHGDIIPSAMQDWIRQKADMMRDAIARWWRRDSPR